LLGLFLNEHDALLSEGLFGGTMSLRWKLLDFEKKKPKVKLMGTKKIGDRNAYVLDYLTGGSNDFKIKLFFDAENYHHLRTEYIREVNRGTPTFGQQNQQANARVMLTEEFGDFQAVDGLNLPHSYRVTFTSNSNSSSNTNQWEISVDQYYVNQKLAPDFFTFDAKK